MNNHLFGMWLFFQNFLVNFQKITLLPMLKMTPPSYIIEGGTHSLMYASLENINNHIKPADYRLTMEHMANL